MLDGRIYHNSRTHFAGGNRRIAWSNDAGETWDGEHESKYLPDGPPDVYGCKGGLKHWASAQWWSNHIRGQYGRQRFVLTGSPRR